MRTADASEGDASFRERWTERLVRVPASVGVADARVVHLPANEPPWTDVGLAVATGDEVTILATGRVVLAEALGLWGGPHVFLWGRFAPGGEVWNGTRDTTTVRADRNGRLELGVYQGEWTNRAGDLATPREAYAALQGGYDVVAIRWRGSAAGGLAALAALAPDEPLVAAESARLASPVLPPAGWEPLWFLGPSEIFRAGEQSIEVRADDDLGILRRPVDFALSPATTFVWRWRVDALPSARAEDTLPTHDYLSIALEFENGLDLTWLWSCALPVGHHFACPLPHWNARETHWVARSGTSELGSWLPESRNVLRDYAAAIPGAAPQRVVAVWLIAVSLFGHGSGRAAFADIELRDGDRRLDVS
jgi:hypothetical protein